jgi:hypothetical protein
MVVITVIIWQGYGPQSIEEKQRLYTLLRNLNFNGESAPASISEPYTPTAQSFGGENPVEGFYSPELRGELGAGLLDLHAMDDTELLSEVWTENMGDPIHLFHLTFARRAILKTVFFVFSFCAVKNLKYYARTCYMFYNHKYRFIGWSLFIRSVWSLLIFPFWQDVVSEPFEASPFMPKEIDDDDEDLVSGSQQVPADNYSAMSSEKESTARENNVAKIKVVVC